LPVKQEAIPLSPFVVGVSRSGTTLLRLMLDSHPDMAIPPETHFIPAAILACRRSLRRRRAFMKAVTSAPFWLDNHLDEDELRAGIHRLNSFSVGAALRVFYKLYAKERGKTRWGDKTPFYVRRMRDIQMVLPEARFIHLIRDGRDVALSLKDLWFGPNSIEETAAHWVSAIENARRQSPALSGYLEIRYEALILQTETTLKKICDFIDLPWSPAMLDYHLSAEERLKEMVQPLNLNDERVIQAEERKAIHKMTSQPPRNDRIGVWKTEMDTSNLSRFDSIAGHMLRELGYDTCD
jgi:Sulfotransferase family